MWMIFNSEWAIFARSVVTLAIWHFSTKQSLTSSPVKWTFRHHYFKRCTDCNNLDLCRRKSLKDIVTNHYALKSGNYMYVSVAWISSTAVMCTVQCLIQTVMWEVRWCGGRDKTSQWSMGVRFSYGNANRCKTYMHKNLTTRHGNLFISNNA